MKNLANCKPSEFLTQTNRIRKSVSKWLTDTDILNIRRRLPDMPDTATNEERKKALQKQASMNFHAILDAVMEEHPEETLEVMALVCFVEPEDVDNHEMIEYIGAINDIINNETVIDFFSSLMRLANGDI